MKESRRPYKYIVDAVYLNTEKDEIEFDYIETLAWSANEARHNAHEYMSRFPFVSHLKIDCVSRV